MLCTRIPNKIAGTTKNITVNGNILYYCILLEAIKGGGRGVTNNSQLLYIPKDHTILLSIQKGRNVKKSLYLSVKTLAIP